MQLHGLIREENKEQNCHRSLSCIHAFMHETMNADMFFSLVGGLGTSIQLTTARVLTAWIAGITWSVIVVFFLAEISPPASVRDG